MNNIFKSEGAFVMFPEKHKLLMQFTDFLQLHFHKKWHLSVTLMENITLVKKRVTFLPLLYVAEALGVYNIETKNICNNFNISISQ